MCNSSSVTVDILCCQLISHNARVFLPCLYDVRKSIYLGYDMASQRLQYNFPKTKLFWKFNHHIALEKASPIVSEVTIQIQGLKSDNSNCNHIVRKVSLYFYTPTVFRRRVKWQYGYSHEQKFFFFLVLTFVLFKFTFKLMYVFYRKHGIEMCNYKRVIFILSNF